MLTLFDPVAIGCEQILKYGPQTLWIVGVSGGADSTALLSVLKETGCKIIAIHCNFGLRGEESDRDESFVRNLCEKMEVELIVTRFDTETYRRERKLSIETACRELRYDFFRRVMKERGAKGIIVAHNKEDNEETMLMNLFRGTGVKGLRGMLPVAKDIYRPFLDVSRKDIEAYLDREGIDYITDSSNLSNDFTRNKIRNLILPLIRKEFPEIEKALSLTRDNIREAEEFMDYKVNENIDSFLSPDMQSLDIKGLQNSTEQAPFVLYQYLSRKGLSKSQIISILNNCNGTEFKIYEANYHKFILDKGKLRFYAENIDRPEAMSLFIIKVYEGPLDFTNKGATFLNNTSGGYFDGDQFDDTKLYARYWQPGDRIKPFGMQGSKKLSDLFTDYKISADQKDQIPLLMYENDILWIPGIRRSKFFPVTQNTKKIVEVRYKSI